MQPGTADFAAGPQAVHRAAAFDIHRYPAHVIVHSRPDRNRISRGIDPCHFAERGNDGIAFCKFRPRMFPRVEEDAMSFRAAAPDRARDDVAGRKFGAGLVRHEALPGVVDQDRAVAAHGFGHQRHRTRRPVEGGRVKLDELEIGEYRACTRRQRQSLAEATGRVGTVQKQPADATCGDHDAAGIDHQRTLRVHGEHALDGIVLDDQAPRLDAFKQGNRRTAAHRCDQCAHDFASGAIAGGVHDPVAAMRGFKAEPPAAVGPPVEGDAKPGEMLDGRRRRVDDAARDGFVAQACTCGQRVGQMQGRVVVVAHRRRKPALCPQARGFRAERRLRQQHDRLGRH